MPQKFLKLEQTCLCILTNLTFVQFLEALHFENTLYFVVLINGYIKNMGLSRCMLLCDIHQEWPLSLYRVVDVSRPNSYKGGRSILVQGGDRRNFVMG